MIDVNLQHIQLVNEQFTLTINNYKTRDFKYIVTNVPREVITDNIMIQIGEKI